MCRLETTEKVGKRYIARDRKTGDSSAFKFEKGIVSDKNDMIVAVFQRKKPIIIKQNMNREPTPVQYMTVLRTV